MSLKIMVTGSRGMLGTDLLNLLQVRQHQPIECDLHNCDILNLAQLDAFVAAQRPAVIIHAAAYTNVDQAETDQAAAARLNATGAQHVATVAQRYHARVVYLSTDYVFDGTQTTPYTETDAPCPQTVYGKTKLQGEQHIQRICGLDEASPTAAPNFLIVRTAWLYGVHGKNFVKAILQRAQQGEPLRVVNDQTGAPTYTQDLAQGILALIECQAGGIVHVTNRGSCTWYDFARAILNVAHLTETPIYPISTAELQRPAPRPRYSVLATAKFERLTGHTLRPWQDGLHAYFAAQL